MSHFRNVSTLRGHRRSDNIATLIGDIYSIIFFRREKKTNSVRTVKPYILSPRVNGRIRVRNAVTALRQVFIHRVNRGTCAVEARTEFLHEVSTRVIAQRARRSSQV